MNSRIRNLALGIIGAGLGSWLAFHFWPRATETPVVPDQAASAEAEHRLRLTPEKAAACGIEVAPAEVRPVRTLATVPGRLQYDDTRHIEVRSAIEGVIHDIPVKPGDVVSRGTVLAIISSPEVGNVRADLLDQRAQLEIAIARRDWEHEIYVGLQQLAEAVRRKDHPETIRSDFQNIRLGAARADVLAAYSRALLAEQLWESASYAATSGSLSGRDIQERQTERDSAVAALDSVLEQSVFDARLADEVAETAVNDARRRLEITQQHLQSLLGDVESMIDINQQLSRQDLSLVEIRAPFDGTIERKSYSLAERVRVGESLFVLADTTHLWLSANLREHEWSTLALVPGDPLTFTLPAYAGETFEARVNFVGREVDPGTNSVPLVATIDNSAGTLRPGMFAEVTIPTSGVRDVLTVPDSAVREHEGQAFVFRRIDETTFECVNVELGTEQQGVREIVAGLTPGDPIVTEGASYLKGELLLAGESE